MKDLTEAKLAPPDPTNPSLFSMMIFLIGLNAMFSSLLERARSEEFFSQFDAPGIIQREYGNCGPAGCREA